MKEHEPETQKDKFKIALRKFAPVISGNTQWT